MRDFATALTADMLAAAPGVAPRQSVSVEKSISERMSWAVWATFPVSKFAPREFFVRARLVDLVRLAVDRSEILPLSPDLVVHLSHAVVGLAKAMRPEPTHDEIGRVFCRIVASIDRRARGLDEVVEAALASPLRFKAATLGENLDVTPDEVARLGLRTVRWAGLSDEVKRHAKNSRRREAADAGRRATGKPTSAEREARAALVREIAEREGISVRTAQRRLAAAESVTSVVSYVRYREQKEIAGRTKRHDVTPAAARKRRQRERERLAKAGPGEPARPSDPASVLAEIVVRSTGLRPAVVHIDGRDAMVLFDPSVSRAGPIIGDHLVRTLKEFGLTVSASFDGRCGVHLQTA